MASEVYGFLNYSVFCYSSSSSYSMPGSSNGSFIRGASYWFYGCGYLSLVAVFGKTSAWLFFSVVMIKGRP